MERYLFYNMGKCPPGCKEMNLFPLVNTNVFSLKEDLDAELQCMTPDTLNLPSALPHCLKSSLVHHAVDL